MSRNLWVIRAAPILLAGWFVFPLKAHSQEEGDVIPQLWVDYNPAITLSDRWRLEGDMGVRTEFEENLWWRVIVRPGVRYSLSQSVSLGGGVGSFYTLNKEFADRLEVRPWQGVRVVWPRWRIPLRHFFRVEERFDFNTESWSLRASLRIRYRLGLEYRWGALVRRDRYWRVMLEGELFKTLAGDQGQFRENVRVGVGVERSFRRERRLLGEVVWQQRGLFFDLRREVNDIYVRIRVFQRWGL
ncbi:MAG: DUF2490 domain-containing protein [Gemmatimonadota bacterium]|nr:MAG: DUF2490 domain-containing protein [Gemmatimonadota bacterium]